MRRQEGAGLVRILIDSKTGRAIKADIVKSTGFASMDDSVIRAARGWHWRPGEWKEVDVPIEFSLAQGQSDRDLGSGSGWRQPTVQRSVGIQVP
jgi:TonB family protein